MFSHPSHRSFLSLFALAAILAPSGCIYDVPDELVSNETSQAPQEISGVTTPASAYPEVVWLERYSAGNYAGLCSGAVIAPRVVLTAAHCVRGASEWRVGAPHASGQTARSVKGTTYDWLDTSPKFHSNQHDIGLVFLDTDIVISEYPVVADFSFIPDVVAIGVMNNGSASSSSLWVSRPLAMVDGTAFGLPFDYLSDGVTELGDSGGPDVIPGTSPHIILAVNSARSDDNIIGVFARVDQVYPWIQDRLRPTSCGPTCPNPIDQSQFFIRQLYLDVLAREPDSAGATFWLNALNSCNGNAACLASMRSSIARQFIDSLENRRLNLDLNPDLPNYNYNFLKHLYWNFLGRQPDTAGFGWWLNVLNSSGDYNDVTAGFITSVEYRSRFGAP